MNKSKHEKTKEKSLTKTLEQLPKREKESVRGRESLYTKNKINQTTQRKKHKTRVTCGTLKWQHTHTDTLSRWFKEKIRTNRAKNGTSELGKSKTKKELVQ